jgi:hypothetical protein
MTAPLPKAESSTFIRNTKMMEMTAAESKKFQIHRKTMVDTFQLAVKLKNQQ